MLSVYLIVMGLLLGYLAEQQKHLRAEKAAGDRDPVEGARGSWIDRHDAADLQRSHVDVWCVATGGGGAGSSQPPGLRGRDEPIARTEPRREFHWLESGPRDAKTYLEDFPGDVCYASIDGDRWSILALDQDGNQVPAANLAPISQLRDAQAFDSLITVTFLFGGEWRGRVFLLNPSWRGEKQEELRFLLNLVRQVGPAVYNVYLLHRLRRRAGAASARVLRANCTMARCNR